MTPEEKAAVIRRVTAAVTRMLDGGWQGQDVEIPETGEVWSISREPS